MDQIAATAEPVQLVFHDDDDTPYEFIIELLCTLFGKQKREAIELSNVIEQQRKVACGPYPPTIAKALLDAAQERIRTAGHPLLITCDAASKTDGPESYEVRFEFACDALAWHFAEIQPNQLATMVRQFLGHMRADVQVAIDKLFASPVLFFGAHEEYRYETLTFARLKRGGRNPISLAPPQYHEVDVGGTAPVKCLHNGLWLCQSGEFRYAVVLSYDREYRAEAMMRVEIAVPKGPAGDAFVQRCFVELERAVHAARSYRGEILSLDGDAEYGGRLRGVMVHRLPSVDREDVILPEQTLRLLDRNVLSFVGTRDALRRLG